MALSVETGQFAANTGSATTTVSHSFGSAPKAVILWSSGQTANGNDTAANAQFSIGFSDGTSHSFISWASDDNVATTNAGQTTGNSVALRLLSNGTPTTLRQITGVTFGASDVQYTWDSTPAAAYLVSYMLFGGTDITNAMVGQNTGSFGTTGDKSDTSVGFQGDFGIFLGMLSTSTVNANISIGFAARVNDAGTSRARQFMLMTASADGQTMTANVNADTYTNNSNFTGSITAGAETVDALAQFGTATTPLGFTSNGFDFNVSNALTNYTFKYLIIKGGQWDVGTSTTPISSGTRSPSTSFTPQGVFCLHGSATANATITIDCNTTVGAATSTSSETCASASQDDAVLNTTCNRTSSNSKILASGSFPTTSVDFTSLDASSFTLTDASGGGTAYQMGWFVCADNAAAPTAQPNFLTLTGAGA